MKATFEPAVAEVRWRQRWEELRLGIADSGSTKPAFSVALPPPNITGALHMGHALNAVIQDSLCRFHRMRGYEVCWVPGTDHAAIATQNVIERQLTQEGSSKEEIGREAFNRRVEAWYSTYQGRIVEQLRRLGASCDWSRERFTLDEPYVRVIRTAFKELFDQGLIYRGPRIVNWCPRCHSAISDEEVEYREHQDTFFFVRYSLPSGPGGLVVATSRPETILADVAVAVPANDPRFAELVGRLVVEPLTGRLIPVVEDEAVDSKLGSGALKITPGHSAEDFEIGLRHNLPVLTVISLDGRMIAPSLPALDGLEVDRAREVAAAMLRTAGAMEREEPLVHQVGHCDRCGAVIEPLVTPQWWVRVADLAEPAASVVEDGEVVLHPSQFRRQYLEWMRGLRDWCISRQIWLGHRIPVSTCRQGHVFAWIDEPERCPECGEQELTADPDVLDTWFSSSLWPFAILGWPNRTADLERFYPTSVLSTGRDILWLWVTRMVMMGLRFTGEVPFHDVILHAIILGADGARQSKSKGNVVDPLEMIDRYGADALRGWGATVAMGTQDSRFDESRLDGFAKFANKLWNMVRLLHVIHFPDGEGRIPVAETPSPADLELVDRWILSRLGGLVRTVTQAMSEFELGVAIEAVYQFAWRELADWYLELVKERLQAEDKAALWVTREALLTTLQVLHPIMPFLSDACAEQFDGVPETLDQSEWPRPSNRWDSPDSEATMAQFQELTGQLRSWLQDLGVKFGRHASKVPLSMSTTAGAQENPELRDYLAVMVPVEWVGAEVGSLAGMAPLVVGNTTVRLATTAAAQSPQIEARMRRELEQLEQNQTRLSVRLAGPFATSAPEDVVQRDRDRLEEASRRAALLRSALQI
ncbi:MAG TPA: valine--tRNA ligase [Candidatus Dormibacteraeota bacterium]|nr:valine--tRNA ligase [Candidatus Dormibacteraeota bacterium]